MIKGILKIKDLGVFTDYTRPAGTQDFALKNLIYGWNYSGKTTLSRLFALLETKQSNPDLAGCAFTFDTDKGPVTEANFGQSDLSVRVFNSDFTTKNLNFTGESFNPILLLGEESEEAQKKLNQCEETARKVQEQIRSHSSDILGLEAGFASAKKKTAAKIKKDIGRVKTYTATHLDKDILHITSLTESKSLSEEQLKTDLKLALTSDQERPIEVDPISVSPSIGNLYVEATAVMAATPDLASTIDHLVSNPPIERWIEIGLPLHVEKEKCEFCGGDLSKQRLTELHAHFSKDLAEHKQKVESLLCCVEQAHLSVNLPKQAELNAQFRDRYKAATINLPAAIKAFNNAVDTLAKDLRKKIDTPFKAQAPTPLADGLTEAITRAAEAINEVIRDNNKIAVNFDTAKGEAIDRVRYHFVQEFLDDFDKDTHEKKVARLSRRKNRLNRFDQVVQSEILKLKAIISQAQLGREDINQRLSSLLGKESVQINVVNINNQERFQLVRKDGSIAKNLSDGEKTAIAFTYFLTKLKEIRPEKFKETIVCIDDPISSLDSNHIFQITAIIKEIFFDKESANDPWITKCKQVFISTHNFEFFHLMRELDPKSKTAARLYLVRKIKSQASTLCDMPKSLSLYSSEYHFLFEIIHRFHQAPDKTDHEVLMLLPNAIRRFVELYTYSRIPGPFRETVDKRAEELFGKEKAKRILKVFHYFSHANSIDRLAGNSDLIFDTEHAVKDLLDAMRTKDNMHLQALEASVVS